LSAKIKTDKDFEDYGSVIEEKAREEIECIRQKFSSLKIEAQKIGDALKSDANKVTAETDEKS
jgi:hypothetical protein